MSSRFALILSLHFHNYKYVMTDCAYHILHGRPVSLPVRGKSSAWRLAFVKAVWFCYITSITRYVHAARSLYFYMFWLNFNWLRCSQSIFDERHVSGSLLLQHGKRILLKKIDNRAPTIFSGWVLKWVGAKQCRYCLLTVIVSYTFVFLFFAVV